MTRPSLHNFSSAATRLGCDRKEAAFLIRVHRIPRWKVGTSWCIDDKGLKLLAGHLKEYRKELAIA